MLDLLTFVGCQPSSSQNKCKRVATIPYHNKGVGPVHDNDFALYTEMKMRAWRLNGEKHDKAFFFCTDPKDAWNGICTG